MKSRRGFTLIELLLVVSMVGILAAAGGQIYKVYISRARSSEALSLLGVLFFSQETFSQMYVTYSTRLDAIGFNPLGVMHYSIGFLSEFTSPAPVMQGTAGCRETCSNGGARLCPTPNYTCAPSASFGVDPNGVSVATQNSFLASAHGNFSVAPIAGETAESWTIDDKKNIRQISGSK